MNDALTAARITNAVATVVAVAIALGTLVQASDPTALGFSPLEARWLALGIGALGILASFLPPVRRTIDGRRRATDRRPGPPHG